jgi:hypothetical protein
MCRRDLAVLALIGKIVPRGDREEALSIWLKL